LPTPEVPEAERQKRKAAVEAALRDGFAPHRQRGGRGSSAAEAARRLGVKRTKIDGWIVAEEQLRSRGEPHFLPDWSIYAEPTVDIQPAAVEERSAVQALQDEITRLKAELKAAYRASVEEDAILSLIGVMAGAEANPPKWLAAAHVKRVKPTPEVPVATWSDWHFGEVIQPGAVNGYNAFNSDIARQRVRRLVDHTIDLCKNHGPGNYPGIVINLLGDFISGGLHPELAKSDEYARIPAALEVRDLLVWALSRMADEFGSVFVPCTSGNHGRDTMKPEYKGYLHHNFDWLVYQLLRRHFERDKRISFLIEPSNEAYYNVLGVRILAMHGDMLGVKGGDGIIGAIGPIMRGEIKTRGQATSLGRPFDLLIIGHWHQELWLPRALVNNSLKGFDEYAKDALRAVPSVPSQSLFFVHPKRGITSRWSVLVDEPKVRESHGWVALPTVAA
jgi:hypothetical protein